MCIYIYIYIYYTCCQSDYFIEVTLTFLINGNPLECAGEKYLLIDKHNLMFKWQGTGRNIVELSIWNVDASYLFL